MARRILIALVGLVLGMNSSFAQPAATNTKSPPPELAGLRERWAGVLREFRVPGLALVVVRGDEVVMLETFGVRDPVGDKPVTPNTQFYIASCTKTYVALAAARLAEQGKLDLRAPLARSLPRFELADPEATQTMTLLDVLCHRPGLSTFPIVFLDAFTGEITEDRYYHFLKSAEPRNDGSYSNVHFTLAGRVIEAVTSKSWRDALDELVFKPAGMTRTTGYADRMYADADSAVPQEMTADGWKPALRKSDRTMHAAGGLGTTANDLARWLRLHINRGKLGGKALLGPATFEQLIKLQSDKPEDSSIPELSQEGFGLAWHLGHYRGHRIAQHGGDYAGAAAFISFLPDDKLGVGVLANAGFPAGPLIEILSFEVYDRLLKLEPQDVLSQFRQRAAERATRQEVPEKISNPATSGGLSLPIDAYLGTYVDPNWGTLVLTQERGELVARIGDLPVLLRAKAADRFELGLNEQTFRQAQFEIAGNTCAAVIVHWRDAGKARFVRK